MLMLGIHYILIKQNKYPLKFTVQKQLAGMSAFDWIQAISKQFSLISWKIQATHFS